MSDVADKDEARKRFADWLAAGWSIAIFENKMLGHPDAGNRVALPYGDEIEHMKVGETKAPDLKSTGMGWKYILVEKCRDIESAMLALFPDPGWVVPPEQSNAEG